ncbi:MAG: hypothetical protein ABWZ88_09895 [Variovorax sp.]
MESDEDFAVVMDSAPVMDADPARRRAIVEVEISEATDQES